MTIVVASLAILETERGSDDANIRSVGDALWWAVTTMTTVGYGDQYPVTATGRLVAVGLMLTGIALIGVVTASLASWLLDRVKAVEQTSQVATATDIAVIAAELAALRAELAEVRRREGVQGLASGGALPSIETHVAQKSALESERPSSGPE
jgi:voltage-gated potassium channel